MCAGGWGGVSIIRMWGLVLVVSWCLLGLLGLFRVIIG